jgi:hypothetical protein
LIVNVLLVWPALIVTLLVVGLAKPSMLLDTGQGRRQQCDWHGDIGVSGSQHRSEPERTYLERPEKCQQLILLIVA